ncbi:MAG: type III-A CRISPR-associated protein Cas10/Csm1 [Tepidimonas sp.]|uniref:type III-A CRISPR-associated protein Cas10/Csm1 n=1 Tax=Tepidimonas sp. TaxID=2002775 RepID=UPI00259EDD21|nr:type III-A CRISPR-associated protein Cas10/Csm1 [Tepidimonas sp.]MDM7457533.1 type III-A CRISPR-associated protein Cas10/Csm1 [Tepidimonas sp.]
MAASCRVALAALLHDLGKFAERARIPEALAKDADGNTRQAIEELLACPESNGRRTHIHAAYTAIAMDLLEAWLPELTGEDMTPFAPWRDKNADDSIINAAARHHRPETFLQWIIATADRLASGFEREEFVAYNQAPDEEDKKLNHYTTRQWTLLEGIHLEAGGEETTPAYRYPLKPLSPEAIFPAPAKVGETGDKAAAQADYLELWQQYQAGLQAIPASHRANLPLWLDHFDSLWLAFTHAIPSATAGIGGRVRPDVSLYDHSRTTAALAVALWRFHADQGHDPEMVRESLRAQWDRERAGHDAARQAWETEKFLLVQGDFTGIQEFIFSGGESQRQVARLLRGRSFYVSLLSELAALKVLEALDLPPLSQVVNAAGKFLVVAPNTPEAVAKLCDVQDELNRWFIEHTYGQSAINLAWLPAAAKDFRHGIAESPFRELIKRLFEQLEAAKLRRFDLCGATPPEAVRRGFLDRFEHGECKIDGRSPAACQLEDGVWVSELAWDQVHTGKWLAHQDRLLITRQRIQPLAEGQTLNQLRLPIFGYHVLFTGAEEVSGKFGGEAKSGNLLRAWDFSLPESADAPLWNGYARRAINAFLPRFAEPDAWESDRYRGLDDLDDFEPHPLTPKTLNHLARDDRRLGETGRWVGVEALMTLKGDIDNLGLIFQKGLERPTFARMAALSRQVNAFFTIWLPWLCRKEFPNTYTVFAGGDDFFLIGPWRSTIRLAQRMHKDFARYVAGNPELHFSAGLSMSKPGLPIRHLAQQAEAALEDAKKLPGKNAVTCFGQSVSWSTFTDLMAREEALEQLSRELKLSAGYLYGLLHLTDMAADQTRPENALWHSRFAYRTRRMLEARIRNEGDRDAAERKRRQLQQQLAVEIASQGIERHRAAYKIALFTYLYQQRD